MNLLIVGTGALATLFAARLTKAGHSITMLGTWQEGISAIQNHGVHLVDPEGAGQQFHIRATKDPHECGDATCALMLVKSWQTERAAEQLAECLPADGLAVTLQNGLGNFETLALSLGPGRVALGSTTTGATLIGPGIVRAGGEGTVSLQRHPLIGPLEAALQSANFNVQPVDDAQSLVWGKLVINAAINPLTALLKVTNGVLLERPSAHELMGKLAQEAADVALAEKIILPFTDPVAMVDDVARKTSANHSSMLQDVLRNARTEIDAICGAVVRIGETHGIDSPVNRACWKLVLALENSALA